MPIDLPPGAGLAELESLRAGQLPPPRTLSGHEIRFVPPVADGEAYEARIWRCGAVATRPGSLHDLYNALIWLNFPQSKAVLNGRHVAAGAGAGGARRDPLRDALTHFDECGAVVVASDPTLLDLIRDFRWQALFVDRRAEVRAGMALLVFGHGSLEALAAPFRGLTAKAVLESVPAQWFGLSDRARVADVDTRLAARLAAANWLRPRDLQPLPLLGWPGMTAASEDPAYYQDQFQFPAGRRRPPQPV